MTLEQIRIFIADMRKGGETGMIRINLDMNMPEECHECPFQLKFKDDEVDPWYMRRCVIMHRNIEYPRPEWCPLEKQEAEAKWIYGEDETGVDGWYCSECNFFEPWFYEFTKDIDFIRFYGHCPKCGRRMTSYTGKPTQSRR